MQFSVSETASSEMTVSELQMYKNSHVIQGSFVENYDYAFCLNLNHIIPAYRIKYSHGGRCLSG